MTADRTSRWKQIWDILKPRRRMERRSLVEALERRETVWDPPEARPLSPEIAAEVEEFRAELKAFLAVNADRVTARAWIGGATTGVYLRINRIQLLPRPRLEVANILQEDNDTCRGFLSAALPILEAKAAAAGLGAVMFENITNPRLIPFLMKRGYAPSDEGYSTAILHGPPCMIKAVA